MRQTRSLYARSNMIIRKFTSASLSTKTMLFNAFCTPIYGCALWCSMYQYSYRKLNIAYNDAFRQLLQEPRWCSASQLFVNNNVSSFAANIHKLVYSLWRSLNASNSVLVTTTLRSDLLVRSPVLEGGITFSINFYFLFAMSFFSLYMYIIAWASSLLLNVNK